MLFFKSGYMMRTGMTKYYEILPNAGNFKIWQINFRLNLPLWRVKKYEGPNIVKLQKLMARSYSPIFVDTGACIFFIWQMNLKSYWPLWLVLILASGTYFGLSLDENEKISTASKVAGSFSYTL